MDAVKKVAEHLNKSNLMKVRRCLDVKIILQFITK